jgi:hypothetical protein
VRQGKGEQWQPAAAVPAKTTISDRRQAGQVYLLTDKGERKATGSYYTPAYIVEYIVENTLGPLVEAATQRVRERGRQAAAADQEAVAQSLVDELLNLKVLDPAMGSGHFLVAATDYLAVALATDPYVQRDSAVSDRNGVSQTPTTDAEEDVTYWRRLVVERCIYGVDRNPLAVELAKLSLWLATVAADQPLSFLDHHLKCGDSLVGARVADLGWPPPAVLGKKGQKQLAQQQAGQMNLFEYRLSQQLPAVMGKVLEIVGQESDSYETVQAKEAADEAVRQLKAPFEAVANLWVSAYFGGEIAYGPAAYDEARDTLGNERLWQLPAVQTAQQIAAERRFFHWELAFPEVFYDAHGQPLRDAAGFDAIIGNPPYIRVQVLRQSDSQASEFLSRTYLTASGSYDLYMLIAEKCLSLICPNGIIGLILPNKFLTASYGEPLREVVAANRSLLKLVDFTYGQVFTGVTTYTCLLFLSGGPIDKATYIQLEEPLEIKSLNLPHQGVSVADLTNAPWTFPSPAINKLFSRLEPSTEQLGNIAERLFQGIRTSANEVYILENVVVTKDKIQGFSSSLQKRVEVEADLCFQFAFGDGIQRYDLSSTAQFVIIPYQISVDEVKLIPLEILAEQYPLIHDYFIANEELLKSRERGRLAQSKNWHGFIYPKNLEVMRLPKIITRDIIENVAFTLDYSGNIAFVTGYGITLSSQSLYSLNYLLAVLNSKFGDFALKQLNTFVRGGYVRIFTQYLEPIPIRRIMFDTAPLDREQLLKKGQKLYDRFCRKNDFACVLGFVEHHLGQQPEQADVVHDLLAYLAEQMIAMNRERQAVTADFWLDLEGVTDSDTFDTLRHKGKWEASLWQDEALRPFVAEESRSTRSLDESLGWSEAAFKAFVLQLARRVDNLSHLVRVYRKHHPRYADLVDRIGRTDRLIDQIVYRLYGLTDEEIAVVVGE